MKQQPEYKLQTQVCEYLERQYPKVLFLSDTVASVKLTFAQQNRNKKIQKHGFKCPDLIILHPNDKFHGLFIELKAKSPFKKDGVTLLSNEHIEEQNSTLNELLSKGYFATFAWSFEMAKEIIDNYLKLNRSGTPNS